MSEAFESPLFAASLALEPVAERSAEVQRIGKRIGKALRSGDITTTPLNVVILSSFMADIVADALAALLLRRRILAKVVVGPYGVVATTALANNAALRDADLVVILPTHRDLAHFPAPGATREDAGAAVSRELPTWQGVWSAITAPIVQLSFSPPPYRPLAELDGFAPGGALRHVRATNLALAETAPEHVTFVDAEALASRVGSAWHDAALYHLCKQPFGGGALVEVAETLAATIAGIRGKARKVLVLDLDNTVWGGVVGDVGLDGIVVGPETAQGEAFLALQSYVKALAGRGVIIAVCSKNEENNAREPFRSHPSMILREADIACFVANFDDKATNLRRIAKTLNVGLDALVFVDDNPAERAWVARELPDVLVVPLPDSPAGYCSAIEATKAFPMSRITKEDIARNASYAARAETIANLEASGDIESFLASLEQVATIEPVGPASLDRIVQLIAKTNQFKLNPTTFTSGEVADNAAGVIALRFRDRMQDYGITAIAVTEPKGTTLHIRNWVMSCRVFSRRLEHAMLRLIRERAQHLGLEHIALDYVPTAKNGLLRDVFADLGFTEVEGAPGTFRAAAAPTSEPRPFHVQLHRP